MESKNGLVNVKGSCIRSMEYPEWMPEEEYKWRLKMYQEYELLGGKEGFLKRMNMQD